MNILSMSEVAALVSAKADVVNNGTLELTAPKGGQIFCIPINKDTKSLLGQKVEVERSSLANKTQLLTNLNTRLAKTGQGLIIFPLKEELKDVKSFLSKREIVVDDNGIEELKGEDIQMSSERKANFPYICISEEVLGKHCKIDAKNKLTYTGCKIVATEMYLDRGGYVQKTMIVQLKPIAGEFLSKFINKTV